MSDENELKNKLYNRLETKSLNKEQKEKIKIEINNLDLTNITQERLYNLQELYQNNINLSIKEKTDKIKKHMFGEWYEKPKQGSDLVILILVITLILIIIYKGGTNILNIILYLLNNFMLPILIILILILLYTYKRNLIFNIYDFLISWFKILSFQWLF
tara:strand:+ start:298 stop:774 length:477 start_codon:yes stop_codon:yes gene_type:complete